MKNLWKMKMTNLTADFKLISPEAEILNKPLPIFEDKILPEGFTRTKVAEDLFVAMKHFGGIGLSANQVGLDAQVFIMGTSKEDATIEAENLATKEKIIKQFLQRNIKLQVHYIPVNTQPYFRKKYKYDKTKYKNSRNFFKRCVSLPIYYDLKKNQLRKIKIARKEIFGLN